MAVFRQYMEQLRMPLEERPQLPRNSSFLRSERVAVHLLRAIERQMLGPAQVTEANILTFPDIANTFGSFVAGELRKAGRVQRK
ncbi:hypothetical protein G3A43_39090 [Paraburkholderia aspalathi]|uniref:hypothetical protein n=1 Tax=Paraburkholderia nemoris TaxID=2793076 RepID=UPI00190BDACF|nr:MULTISPECIES: hypothetical protein [Paraburkholderia]MBK3786220.1 hypothetical protein [Paraburkholderia aspalathi]